MKKLMIAPLLASTASFAALPQRPEPNTIWERLRTFDAKPCDYWRSTNEGGFVCQNVPFREEIPEGRSTSRVIRQLQQEIDSLKKQVQELQSR